MRNILLVDLNNFGRYPTISIGYLAAVLRDSGMQVSVFAPLNMDIQGVNREPRPHKLSLVTAKINYRAAVSSYSWIRGLREYIATSRRSAITAQRAKVVAGFEQALSRVKPHLVIVSTYLMYRDICIDICAACNRAGVPVILGGPYFAQYEVVKEWIGIKGLTALAAGEVELQLPSIVTSLSRGEDLSQYQGVFVASDDGQPKGRFAPPLNNLDDVPFPDFSAYPWDKYPHRIVPIITGRGCKWGACSFCSDVTSTAGRRFRSRSPRNVLSEISHHHKASAASRFVFVDLKLNSNLEMWRSIISGIQQAAPGARWIGSVHVGQKSDQGLSEADLRAAAESGCVRLTTGLESGSQKVINLMRKGTSLNAISAFLHIAKAAGISCRCTMILGYPDETAEDVHASAEFLERHIGVIERVSLNRLQIITGTRLHRELKRNRPRFQRTRITNEDHRLAQVSHENSQRANTQYHKAAMRLIAAVYSINRNELSLKARDFEGVM